MYMEVSYGGRILGLRLSDTPNPGMLKFNMSHSYLLITRIMDINTLHLSST